MRARSHPICWLERWKGGVSIIDDGVCEGNFPDLVLLYVTLPLRCTSWFSLCTVIFV